MEQVLEKEKIKIKAPKLWNVIFLNDDFTPMDFVMLTLIHIFNKSQEDSHRLMMEVHEKGSAVIAKYPKDVAKTKQEHTINFARQNQFPLSVVIEQE